MKGRILVIVFAAFLQQLISCNSGNSPGADSITSDSAAIAKGGALFARYCSGCHNFRQDDIGPQLSGITAEIPADWLQHFIKDPKKLIGSGDARAAQLFKRYKVFMPSFAGLTDDDVRGIIGFLNTHKKRAEQLSSRYGKEIVNPVPDSIRLSNLVVGLTLFTQIPASNDSGKWPAARITKLDFEPHSGNIFILDLRGKLYKMQNNKPVVYLDMAKLRPKLATEPGLGTGFGSFAFHPDFAKNGLLYTAHAEAGQPGKADYGYADSIKVAVQWVLTEWKTSQPEAAIFSGTSRELLRINMPYIIHGIQEIAFNPGAKPGSADYGMLYAGIGDGGCVEQGYPFLTHSLQQIWGTIIRIDPLGRNSPNGQYGIPPDNPFTGNQDQKTHKEIYAYGFKNPHRITWSKSGKMIVCNIGQANVESVNMVMPGRDFGWPVREGTFVLDPLGDLNKVYPLPANDSIYNITYPIAQYGHHGGWTAISGGFEYSGRTIPQLAGKFLFGDIPSGKLFYMDLADVKQGKQATIQEWGTTFNGVPKTLKELCGNDRVEMRFGRDANGELYILSKADGKVYKLVSATIKTPEVH